MADVGKIVFVYWQACKKESKNFFLHST